MERNFCMPAQFELLSGSRGEQAFAFRRIAAAEAAQVLALQARVRRFMPDPTQLAGITEAELMESIREDLCLGAFVQDRLAAFSLLVTNRDCPERNLGQKLGHPAGDCVTFDIVFVDPDFRGYGMQTRMLQMREEAAVALGARLGFVTVSPENEYSLRNVRGRGFEVLRRARMYGGLDRYILVKRFAPEPD